MELTGSPSAIQVKEEKVDSDASLYIVEGLESTLIKEEYQVKDEILVDPSAMLSQHPYYKKENDEDQFYQNSGNQMIAEDRENNVEGIEMDTASFEFVDCSKEMDASDQHEDPNLKVTKERTRKSRHRRKQLNLEKINYFGVINESLSMVKNERLKVSHFCIYCNRDYKSSSNLKTHLILHTSARPYACQHCKRKFKQKVHLKYHVMRHTGEKPYLCQYCPASFIQKSSMKMHEKKVHK